MSKQKCDVCHISNGLGMHKKLLHIVDGNMNAEKYRKVLGEQLKPSIPQLSTEYGEFIFQQDGASCHTARATKAWLAENEIPILDWPSGSPDLSTLETLWGKMKRYLKNHPCPTKYELIVALKSTWASITDEYCHKLVDTMSHRVNDVITRKGDVTNWLKQ